MIRQFHDRLPFRFIADFRPAEDDLDVRPHAPDGRDHLGRFRHVPDIDAEADDPGFAGEQDFRDVQRTLVDVKLRDYRARLQFAEIGEEITQPERGVDELRVECGEDDVRHPHKPSKSRPSCQSRNELPPRLWTAVTRHRFPPGRHVSQVTRVALTQLVKYTAVPYSN